MSLALKAPVSSDLSFRLAEYDDSAAIRNLIESIVRSYNVPFEIEGEDKDLVDITRLYNQGSHRLWVVETARGGLVGTFGFMAMERPGLCRLVRFYLATEMRGSGLGRWMLEKVLEQARAEGYTDMVLDTHPAFVEAIGLYRKMGFTDIDEFPGEPASFCPIYLYRPL